MIFDSLPATSSQYFEMFLFIIGMIIFSQLFNRFFGLKASNQMQSQEKIRELQQELLENQDDPNELMRLQGEMGQIMKETMKKTLLPSCIRCAIFMGVFSILGFMYGNVDFMGVGSGYFMFYFLVSIGISLAIYFIKRMFKNIGPQKEEPFVDVARAMRSPIIGLSKLESISQERKEDIMIMKRELEEKVKRGELPSDLDINAEINRIIQENLELDSNQITSDDDDADFDSDAMEDSKKSWKKRLSEDN